MKSLILYGSPVKLTNAHKLVTVKHGLLRGAEMQPAYFVRAKVFNGDIDRALTAARPMAGETLLNTVEI